MPQQKGRKRIKLRKCFPSTFSFIRAYTWWIVDIEMKYYKILFVYTCPEFRTTSSFSDIILVEHLFRWLWQCVTIRLCFQDVFCIFAFFSLSSLQMLWMLFSLFDEYQHFFFDAYTITYFFPSPTYFKKYFIWVGKIIRIYMVQLNRLLTYSTCIGKCEKLQKFSNVFCRNFMKHEHTHTQDQIEKDESFVYQTSEKKIRKDQSLWKKLNESKSYPKQMGDATIAKFLSIWHNNFTTKFWVFEV